MARWGRRGGVPVVAPGCPVAALGAFWTGGSPGAVWGAGGAVPLAGGALAELCAPATAAPALSVARSAAATSGGGPSAMMSLVLARVGPANSAGGAGGGALAGGFFGDFAIVQVLRERERGGNAQLN